MILEAIKPLQLVGQAAEFKFKFESKFEWNVNAVLIGQFLEIS